MSSKQGSLVGAVLLGFIANVAFGFIVPAVNELIGGALAGYIAGGTLARGALAGFLAGILGGLILSLIILALLPLFMPILAPILGPFTGLLPLTALIPIIFSLKGTLLSAIGGVIGNLIAAYTKK